MIVRQDALQQDIKDKSGSGVSSTLAVPVRYVPMDFDQQVRPRPLAASSCTDRRHHGCSSNAGCVDNTVGSRRARSCRKRLARHRAFVTVCVSAESESTAGALVREHHGVVT